MRVIGGNPLIIAIFSGPFIHLDTSRILYLVDIWPTHIIVQPGCWMSSVMNVVAICGTHSMGICLIRIQSGEFFSLGNYTKSEDSHRLVVRTKDKKLE
jgi:hypothetical protein